MKGPQICSINSGFLKIEIIIEQFKINRIIYVFGFMSELFFTIFYLFIINFQKKIKVQILLTCIIPNKEKYVTFK